MKQRLHYFDILKGIAIFMVVMGHVICFNVREIGHAPLFRIIGAIHMPLFFFISGWFTFRLTSDGRVSIPHLGKRALQLLVPMVVVSSIWIWYFPYSGIETPLESTFSGLWKFDMKNGYWFTLVLFEIMLIYTAMCPILSRCKSATTSLIATIVAWGIFEVALMAFRSVVSSDLYNITSLGLTLNYPNYIL